jgi:class 3 adenylate cyclase
MNDSPSAIQEEIDGILHQLKQPGVHSLDLLQEYWLPRHDSLWQSSARLYAAFARKLVSEGHPARAIELLREGIQRAEHQDDLELQYVLGLAFARGGNRAQADSYLKKLETVTAMPPELRVEALSLRGRLFKDQYRRLARSEKQDPASKHELQKLAEQSAELYHRAYDIAGDLFPLINYATMSVLEAKIERGKELAARAIDLGRRLRDDPGGEKDYWLAASIAEGQVILGQMSHAVESVREAIRLAGPNSGDINALRRNLLLLKDRLLTQDLWEAILAECKLGNVLVFAGHLLDSPIHPRGRFPNSSSLVRQVQARIHEALTRRNATVGFCSAANGSDLLFAQQLLAIPNSELHVVLPFRKEDFLKTSVDYGLPELEPWRKRFESVLSQAKHVHYATTESYLDDKALFDFANTILQGLALTRAEERGVEAEALVVLDQGAAGQKGGTRDFIDKWKRRGGKCEVIDLAELRSAVGIKDRPGPVDAGNHGPTVDDAPSRQIRAMLFADVKGFSKLAEEHFRRFFGTFLKVVRGVVDEASEKPLFSNTWGDGLFVVFEDVVAAADFASRLLRAVDGVDWIGEDFPEKLMLRIGLHCGPVYHTTNPLTERPDFFGSHVNRAARIEPVTTPGCAFVSEQFAAALRLRSDHPYLCEFVGIEKLAKEYDSCPLYRLTTR